MVLIHMGISQRNSPLHSMLTTVLCPLVVGPGRFPPMMHRQQMPDGQWGAASPYSRSHSAEAIAKAKGGGIGGGGKSNLMGQIIPIYGFGILLYILYILFKITSKGKIGKPQNRFPALKSENMKRKITDYELAQLQEKLRETEEVMERIVSKAGHSPDRIKTVTVEHEEKLLRQLKEITRVMQEGKLVEGIDELSPEMEAEEASYTEDWEGYPEETYPVYDEPGCRQRYDTIILEKPETELLSPEELAERMEEEAEEIGAGPEPDQAESEREEAGPDRDEAKPDRDAAVTDREEAEPDRNTAEPYREEAEPDRNTAEPDREEAEPDRNTAEPDREEAELCLPEAPPQNSEVEVVGGVHAPVHALLVSGNPALDSESLRGWSQTELLQVTNLNGWLTRRGGGCRGSILERRG
ncbi:hypothetical protein JZ751_020807, partial [Albula glossodonta]